MAQSDRIVCISFVRLGDMLQASPIFYGLKQENPNCKVTVVIDKSFAHVCRNIPGIDEILEVDLTLIHNSLLKEGDGIVSAYAEVDRVVGQLRAKNFTRCINLTPTGF